jgi:hypothetical protein
MPQYPRAPPAAGGSGADPDETSKLAWCVFARSIREWVISHPMMPKAHPRNRIGCGDQRPEQQGLGRAHAGLERRAIDVNGDSVSV